MSKPYDVVIVGSGTAGQSAAFALSRNGINVGLVEYSELAGGTCALSGCQAKKWFYEGTETVARSRHAFRHRHHIARIGQLVGSAGCEEQIYGARAVQHGQRPEKSGH